ncbi:tyrosine phosphatase family-domain-containing protein [Fimicolochytrium jonesii]|uniref:tyrosine phosphatase family-domain-containing protein n=1 Tax=Fimicolochytrium jonesii TaxID=1396493 RepID=UPI0022FE45A2|nr:tyrosine phosphatase family-domain-containing protein [Fimicolochytrium jonesii]KAI8820841.1 tyrosine phosphatase family-domain-containing protein [Fimicolochytrium jonesii]
MSLALAAPASLPRSPPSPTAPATETSTIPQPPQPQRSLIVPPLNFAMVAPGVYRSGYPNRKNFPFLQTLRLRCIMYLCEDDYSADNIEFLERENVRVLHVRISGNKEPFGEMDHRDIAAALVQVLDTRNHPILIHCNKGAYRIGCLVGCLRKLQNWSLTSIFDEYRRFAGPKIRIADQEFIEVYSEPVQYAKDHAPSWL